MVIALVGITGFGTAIAGAVAVIVLAEILVRRQRLALPAVALTIATAIMTGFLVSLLLGDELAQMGALSRVLTLLSFLAVALGLFVWRYRVPMAWAGFISAVSLIGLVAIFRGLQMATGVEDVFETYRPLSVAILIAAALILFAVALRYDLSDPKRVTTRSDVAFWLHLVTAPALLCAFVSIFAPGGLSLSLFRTGGGMLQMAGPVIGVVAVLMAIGIVLDRRAFVTSGLVSLISAVVTLLRQGQMETSSPVFLAMLAVGALVLIIGIGWRPLRRSVVGRLPGGWQVALPPLA